MSDHYQITKVGVTVGLTEPHPTENYASLRADVSLEAQVEGGANDCDQVVMALQKKANEHIRRYMARKKKELLEDD